MRTPDFLQLRAYTKSATGMRERILTAYFVELDPIMILEKTAREKLVVSQTCEHPYMTKIAILHRCGQKCDFFSRNAKIHGWSMERNF